MIFANSILSYSCAQDQWAIITSMANSYYGAPVNRHLCFSMVLSSALLTQRPVGKNQRSETKQRKQCNRSQVIGTMCTGRGLVGSERQSVVAGCFYTQRLGFPRSMLIDGLGTGFFLVSRKFPFKTTSEHAQEIASLGGSHFVHFFTSSWGLDFFFCE